MSKADTYLAKQRKPRGPVNPEDYVKRKKAVRVSQDAPRTTATKPAKHDRSNLTLHDWLSVVDYYDRHQPMTQAEVVRYFKTCPDGVLVFNQSSLSRHLSAKGRAEDQRLLQAYPTSLSAKRTRVVTRPDVELALYKWVKHMESKNEHVTGVMLMEKRARFEASLDVPEKERLRSEGWIRNFCRA